MFYYYLPSFLVYFKYSSSTGLWLLLLMMVVVLAKITQIASTVLLCVEILENSKSGSEVKVSEGGPGSVKLSKGEDNIFSHELSVTEFSSQLSSSKMKISTLMISSNTFLAVIY